MNNLDTFFFTILPYVAFAVFLVGFIYRYKYKGFQFTSLSSQFLERKKLFWGSVPFHWGVIVVFFGHLTAFLFPRTVLLWNSVPVRLFILEITGFIFGLSMMVGLINLVIRRFSNSRLRMVMNNMDVVVYVLLLLQTFTGLWIAYNFRWGSSWFSSILAPYLYSIFKLNPDISVVSTMPFMIKLHIIGAFSIIGIIPFTRLVHFFVYPLNYLWRPFQQVRWYWEKKVIRRPGAGWTFTKPKNN